MVTVQADIARALEAGVPARLVAVLVRARALWRLENSGEPSAVGVLVASVPAGWWVDDELTVAVRHPAAAVFDEVFVAAMRRRGC